MSELIKALEAVLDAIGDYMPPDGIGPSELISRVIYATDNPNFNNAWRKHVRASAELEWDGWEVRAPTGDLYAVSRLSDIVWVALKNGTQIEKWETSEALAKDIALQDFRRIASLPTSEQKEGED